MLAVAPNGRTNVGSVGRCDVGFRHEESRADLAVHQRSEPAVLVRPCPVTMENFHVPGVWSRTVENLGGPADPAHLFSAQRIFDVGEPLSRKDRKSTRLNSSP